MLRRVVPALLLAATSVAGALVASPAHAMGICQLRVPARITVQHPRTVLQAQVTGGCRSTDGFGAWQMSKDDGDPDRVTDVYYDEPSDGARASLDLYASSLEWGRNTLHPQGAGGTCSEATDYDDCALPQNTPVTDVRLASRSALSVRRNDRCDRSVTLRGTSAVYSPTADRFVRRTARGQFQWRARGRAWRGLRTVTTSRTGTATTRVVAPRGRRYRFVTAATGSWWTSRSPTVRR